MAGNNPFAELNNFVSTIDLPDAVTRKQVGLRNSSPFVDGYFYLYIDLPKAMKDQGMDVEQWRKLFAGLSVNFTPPSTNINYGDVQHMGGVSKHYSGGTKNNDFSITYNEMSGLPVFTFHKLWANLIFDEALGLANVDVVGEEYKCTFLVIQTTPVGGIAVNKNFKFEPKHIEQVWLLRGVAPPSDLQEGAFNPDISSPQAGKQLSYSYTADDWYTATVYPQLKQMAADILNNKIFQWTVFRDISKLLSDQKFAGSIFSSGGGTGGGNG